MPRGSVPQRTVLPLILASAGVCAALTTQGQWWTALALLFCPGWGISRILSRANRGFGLAGSSLCLSFLVLAAIPVVSTTAWINLDQDQMGPLLLAIMLILVLLGMNRLQRWDRWKAKQPPPHQPMPAWPSRTFACLIVLGLALVALVFAEPFGIAKSGTLHLWEAGRAMGWARGGENPFLAGTPLPINGVLSAATAGLFLASGIHPVIGVQLLMASALTAVLFHIAEGISRLWGNIGGLRAMLAFLLGLNPLASFFLLGAQHRGEILPSLSPGFDDGLTVALQPFLEGSQLSLTLAFTAMLLSCTLSTLRRASYHVPRLAGAAAFGLAVTSPPTMLLLLPAWIVGIAMSHVACRHHPDNDPNPGNPIRRAGEPLLLRSPFWRPVIPIVVGGWLGLLLADPVQPSLMPARPVAWAILASVGPACLLFMPGIRHLNASPGREAFFFSGIVTLVAATAMSIDLYGDQGEHAVRILSLLLAIPCANGVIKMIEIHRSRARTILSAMVVFLVPAQIAVVYEHAQRPVTLVINMESGVSPASQIASPEGNRIEILQKVSRDIPADAVIISDEFRSPASREIATLITGRSLLGQRVDQTGSPRWEREAELRRALVKRLALGDGTALA
ncbi:MAG: hypothetical protein VX916_05545, partial [Planctomycetota bacterium]|nr:hypothetical protein [Planctomycetota bacterium]